jgi:hypothetical protein
MAKYKFSGKQWLFVAFLALILLYSLFQARFLILGPQVKIISPTNGASVPAGLVVVTGSASNVSWLSLDDRQIFTDQLGRWSEKLIASPGTSIITVKARDRFGRTKVRTVDIFAN